MISACKAIRWLFTLQSITNRSYIHFLFAYDVTYNVR